MWQNARKLATRQLCREALRLFVEWEFKWDQASGGDATLKSIQRDYDEYSNDKNIVAGLIEGDETFVVFDIYNGDEGGTRRLVIWAYGDKVNHGVLEFDGVRVFLDNGELASLPQ